MSALDLLFDVQVVQGDDVASGPGRCTVELARAAARRGAGRVRLLLHPDRPQPGAVAAGLASLAPLEWATRPLLRAALSAPGGAVLHIGSPWEPVPLDAVLPRAIAESGAPVTASVHDLAPLRAAGAARARRAVERAALLRRCDLVVVPSAAVRAGLEQLAGVDPERVVVVGAAPTPGAGPGATAQDHTGVLRRALPTVRPGFVLHLADGGGQAELGAVDDVIDAYGLLPPELRRDHQLVVVAATWAHARARSRALAVGVAPEELVLAATSDVDDAMRLALLHAAGVAAFPSLHGDVGLGARDALACGAPTIGVAAAMSELLDDPRSTPSPQGASALAAVMARVLDDEAFSADLRSAARRAGSHQPSWDQVAGRVLDAIDALVGRAPGRRRSVPRRLAVVSPYPPSTSGVATYTARVVDALAEHVEVARFRDTSDVPAIAAARDRLLPAGALGRTVPTAGFDDLLYVLGNSGFHRQVLALARRHAGVAWLHEASLAGAYLTAAHARPGGEVEMRRALASSYGGLVPAAVADGGIMDFAAYRGSGTRLLGEVVRASRGVIVTTDLARRLLVADLGPSAHLPPIAVVPLATPPPPPPLPRQDPPLVVSLGWVNVFKAPEVVLAAFARVRAERPCRLALVGPVDPPGLRQDLLDMAASLGIADDVTITGEVEAAEFDRWRAGASCALQLRTSSDGEASATVLEALASGVPVVTNVATAADLRAPGLVVLPLGADQDVVAAAVRRALDDDTHVRPPTRTPVDVAHEVLSFLGSLRG